jgi:energy-coupling factor transporter ATP-binding protein EcfA2
MPEQGLREWLGERPLWLQEAAKRIFDGQSFTPDDLAGFCVHEAMGSFVSLGFALPGGLFGTGAANALRLISIQDIQGINALSPKKALSFGNNNLAIVYGLNGSGKSGYVRVLKHACGARHPGELHQNVFTETPSVQKCQITYEKDGSTIHHEWIAASGIVGDLCGVDIFDTMCGRIYAAGENEVTYEPPVLSFLSDLISISEDVSTKLDQIAAQLSSSLPKLPQEYANTQSGTWLSSISSQTKSEQISLHCEWSETLETEFTDLQARLSEKSPADKAKFISRQKLHLDALTKDLEENISALSDDNCQQIIELKRDFAQKKQTAKIAAEQVFQGAPLDGIGTETWKQLWEKARQYSEQEAYKETVFPNTEDPARCVLCQQPLSPEASGRFQSFESYVKGTLESEAANAEEKFKNAIEALPAYAPEDALREKLDACGWTDEDAVDSLIEIFVSLKKRQEELLSAENTDNLCALPESNVWLEQAHLRSIDYAVKAQKFTEDSSGDNRAGLQGRLLELQAKKWLSQQQEPIAKEAGRLLHLDILQAAKRLTSTIGLSKKKGELAEQLITDAFVQGFNNELTRLGARRIRIELVKSKVTKGQVLHKLRLCSASKCSLEDVLSEGEFRIIALAAFLADVAGKTSSSPFVFDDPISSLDQDYEEAVVQRLIELAQDRQLIVFTHRLSLLGLLQDYGKKADIEPEIICVRQEEWGTGEPGDTPLFAKKPDKALNSLINDRLVGARKIREEHGQEFYEPIAKALCSDFRILLERMIESDLLADVVQRYRRAINTMGKIDKLARITAADCKLFDDMMTKYSRYEHSQPGEAPVQPPLPDELRQDFEAVKAWRTEFISRGV